MFDLLPKGEESEALMIKCVCVGVNFALGDEQDTSQNVNLSLAILT